MQASSQKKVIVAQKEDSQKVNKVCKAFFNKFEIGKDVTVVELLQLIDVEITEKELPFKKKMNGLKDDYDY